MIEMSATIEEYVQEREKKYAFKEKLDMIKILLENGTPAELLQKASNIDLEIIQNLKD